MTTRFDNILSNNDSATLLFKERIKKDRPITSLTSTLSSTSMFSSQTCNLVLKTNTTNKEGEIFVLYMGKFFKIINRMIQLAEQIVNSVSTVSATVKKILASQKNTKPIILPKIIIVKVQRYGYEINL